MPRRALNKGHVELGWAATPAGSGAQLVQPGRPGPAPARVRPVARVCWVDG